MTIFPAPPIPETPAHMRAFNEEQRDGINQNERSLDDAFSSAWNTVTLLEGLIEVARTGAVVDPLRGHCLAEFYRVTFFAVYMEIGAIVDTDDYVQSLPRLIARLAVGWASQPGYAPVLDEARARLAAIGVLRRAAAWRNKVIAHRTNRVFDMNFYNTNRLEVVELRTALDELQSIFNSLTINSTGHVLVSTASIPGLSTGVQALFGVADVQSGDPQP